MQARAAASYRARRSDSRGQRAAIWRGVCPHWRNGIDSICFQLVSNNRRQLHHLGARVVSQPALGPVDIYF